MNGLKPFLMKTAVALMKCAYVPFRACSVKKRITVISRQSNEPTTDIVYLRDWFRENHTDVEFNVLCRQMETVSKVGYVFHMFRQMKALATSKVILLDGYCIVVSVLSHRESQKVVQMWHALAAIKKFGYQTVNKPSGRNSRTAEIMCMHRNYDIVICPGEETGKHFCQAFDVDESCLEYYGLPRIDDIMKASLIDDAQCRDHIQDDFDTISPLEFRNRVRQEYGLKEGQEIILYAPTFRKDEKVDVESLEAAVDPERFKMIVKLHPLYDDEKISDNRYSTYEWLIACDRIITDYSALGVECALTGKPLYYYVYDIEYYRDTVGLNVDPTREIPEVTALNSEEMKTLLMSEYPYDSLKRFREKYVSVPNDNCTGRLGEYLNGIMENN